MSVRSLRRLLQKNQPLASCQNPMTLSANGRTFQRKSLRRALLSMATVPAFLLSHPMLAGPAYSQTSVVLERLDIAGKVLAIETEKRSKGGDAVHVQTSNGWAKILPCEDGKRGHCLLPGNGPLAASLPDTDRPRLPDGKIAVNPSARGGDIKLAWLSDPTSRYQHGVLGDAIEAGSVSIQTADGRILSFALPEDSVFEDITPRLADLNGDGKTEIILVRSYKDAGGALVVLAIRDQKLKLVAEAAKIGRANRWLNPSLIGMLDGSGKTFIGLVRTPHIGGQLQIWHFDGQKLSLRNKAEGFSNHSIGSRALGLSALVRKGGLNASSSKQQSVVILPDSRQSSLILLDGENLDVLDRIKLPARPVTNFGIIEDEAGHQFVLMGLADGGLYQLSDPDRHLFN